MIAQFISDSLIKYRKPNFVGKLVDKIFRILRKIYLKINGNTLITFNLEGHRITVPFQHPLPIVRKIYKYYDSAIGRIPKYLTQKYSKFQAIDIGANVGDTAIIIKTQLDIPILCIEAENFYFQLLQLNTRDINGISYEQCFVGDLDKNNLQLITFSGSARLVHTNEDKDLVRFKSLSEIIKKHNGFNNVKYLKIDTDGFDCKIIRSNLAYIKMSRPVIFFEYDPNFLNQLDDDGLSVFIALSEIGYENLLIYDNTGVFLISAHIKDFKTLEELHLYYSGRQSEMFIDICVFHKEDNDIYSSIRDKEFKYFCERIDSKQE